MKTVSMLELRRQFPKVLRWLQTGKEIVRLTYRGKPIADLTPVKRGESRPPKSDPFYAICDLAADGPNLSNKQIDQLLYGETTGVR